MGSISPLKDGAIAIKQKTEDDNSRALVDTVHAKLVLIEAATHTSQDVGPLLGDTEQAIDDLRGGHGDFVFRQRLAVEKASAFAHDMILIAIIPATLLGLVIAIVLSINLLRVFGTASSLATSIASGNLENDLRIDGQGEAAELARDLLLMQAALRQNISVLRATAGALQQSENRIRGVAETLPGFLFQCVEDQDGGIRFRVIGSNKFEFPPSTMTVLQSGGDLSLDFVMEEDRLNLEKTIQAARDSGHNWEHAFRVPASDGSLRWVRATAGLVPGNGTKKVWNGIALDETDRIATAAQYAQLQARLRQAEKIESIGTLAGGMAHEINNLLQPIIMMTELVLMDLPDNGDDNHARLQQVIDAGSMAAEIVQRLGAFGRTQEVSQDLLDIADVSRDAVAFIRTILPTSVTLHVDIDESVGRIRGDKTQLTQILINLATNARDAIGPRTGHVWVSLAPSGPEVALPMVGGATLKPAAYVTITVRDSGSGIDQATLERIFEPFFTTKMVGQGTGLGLSVTLGIVTSHGGTIQVASTPGKGTSFSILLPIEEAVSALALAS